MNHDPNCKRCRMFSEPGDWLCGLVGLRWNVTKAMKIVADGRKPVPVPVCELAEFLAPKNLPMGQPVMVGLWHSVHWPHVQHVDPTVPGIMGVLVQDNYLIDGYHRVARCQELGIEMFQVYVLSKKESDSLLDDDSRRFLRRLRRKFKAPA